MHEGKRVQLRAYLSKRSDDRRRRGVSIRVLVEALAITVSRKDHNSKHLALIVSGHVQELVRMTPCVGGPRR